MTQNWKNLDDDELREYLVMVEQALFESEGRQGMRYLYLTPFYRGKVEMIKTELRGRADHRKEVRREKRRVSSQSRRNR